MTDDYHTGAFVAAPVGGLLWGFGALALRLAFQWTRAKITGQRFTALDRPVVEMNDQAHFDGSDDMDPSTTYSVVEPGKSGTGPSGKFF